MTAVLDQPTATAPDPSTHRARLVLVVAATALVALVAGLLLGRGMEDVDVDDPVSVGFLQDMTTHHAQAVEMAEVVHRRSADPELQYLAFDIMTTQQGQIGIMSSWLELWDEPRSATGSPMAWMGHEGPMPGMASREQVAALSTLPVPEMEEHFLALMLDHHRGALGMASAAAQHAESADVAALAQGMHDGQAAEIALMERMLTDRGAEVPVGGHDGH